MACDIPRLNKKNRATNLLSHLKYSNYKSIQDIIDNIFNSSEQKTFNLPKIITVGGESSGKSSLLEHLIKCHIFPKNKRCCTRQPIRLILRNGEDFCKLTINKITTVIDFSEIYDYINRHFEEQTDILDEEITIEIHKKQYLNMEIYDLPGLAVYPENKAEKTYQISKKYLSEPDTIVVVVVPSTENRISNQISIKLVKDCGREADTFIALTMIDRVQDEYICEHIIDRITEIDDEVNDLQIKRCIGIQSTRNTICNLFEVDSIEKETIAKILKSINENSMYKKYKDSIDTIRVNLGIENMIKHLHDAFMPCIRNTWQPRIIDRLNQQKEKINIKVEEIGTQLSKELMLYIIENNLYSIFYNVIESYITKYNEDLVIYTSLESFPMNLKKLNNHIQNTKNIIKYLSEETMDRFAKISVIDYNGSNISNLNLSRFSAVIDKLKHIINTTLTNNHQDMIESIHIIQAIYANIHFDDCNQSSIEASQMEFYKKLHKFIMSFMISRMKQNICSIVDIELTESSEISEMRNALINEMHEIDVKINQLHNLMVD